MVKFWFNKFKDEARKIENLQNLNMDDIQKEKRSTKINELID